MNITYTKCGDYLLPNLTLAKKENKQLNKYGLLRLEYLKNNKKVLYQELLMKDKMNYPGAKPSIVHRTIASLRERGIKPSVLTNAILYEASLEELNPKEIKWTSFFSKYKCWK